MRFNYENRKDLASMYIHDLKFIGYRYDYESRIVELEFMDIVRGDRKIRIAFNNVIFLEMQSCSFWHGGDSLYFMSAKEDTEQICESLDWEEIEL